MNTRTLSLLAAAVLLGIVVGCGGSDEVGEKISEKVMEKALSVDGANVSVDLDDDGETGSITIKGEDGAVAMTFGDKAEVPDDFPKDVPIYKGADINAAQTMGGNTFMVQALTTDAVAEVSAFYKKAAVDQGWTEQMSMNTGDGGQMLTYQKDGRTFSVTLGAEDGKTAIHIMTAAGN